MTEIKTKYAIGDVVYHAGTTTIQKQHPCPDCSGERKWKAKSPVGGEYSFACPRCSVRYQSNSELSLEYTTHAPLVSTLTIGSVRYDSHHYGDGPVVEYMCRETGVGSGSIYKEKDLFATREEAEHAAETLAKTRDSTVAWVAKRYAATLELSDYKLESVLMKTAQDAKSYARRLLWNLNDLFSSIEEAEDKDAILEAIEDYKQFYMEGDKAKTAS